MKLKGSTIKFMVSASLMALTAASAHAQTPSQDPATAAAPEENGEVVVVGVRRAEQSAINRKKRAATAQDSIVADDVGQFPDKNAAEAIARIAGVALDLSDSGEQAGFTIRGQTADLIRVEVDGMSVLDNTGGQGGRSAQLNELSSDLIKSVDVIKGQTADMTPGGVGGTVRIEQRSGLDFKEPMYKLNLQYQSNSLAPGWSPRVNAFATRKFFDDRLGVLLNFTYDDAHSTSDFARVSDKEAGYIPLGDHDNSAGKTFTTPFDPVAAAVTNKTGCAALPTTGSNSRLTCYAQWEDFVPSLPRFGRGDRQDKKTSIQLRADFRVNDNLTIFASYNPNVRDYLSQDYNLSIATPSGSTSTAGALVTNMRNVVVNDNHYVTQYDIVRWTGTGTAPQGYVSSLNYNTQVRDIVRRQEQHYLQAGADFNYGLWKGKARFQYGKALAEREDRAFSFLAPLSSSTFKIVPENGLWTFEPPANVDLSSAAAYYPVIGSNGLSSNSQFEYTPQADESSESNYQLDMTRRFETFGPLTAFKFGVQHRNFDNTTWREGGFTMAPGLVVSRSRSLDQVRACRPSSTVTCQFGSTSINGASPTSADRLYKNHTLTEAQYQEMINAALIDLPGGQFFGGFPDRGSLLDTWATYDMDVLLSKLGQWTDLSDYSLDCLYRCVASDGKIYDKPTFSTNEKTMSAYAMVDFETKVFGMDLMGNLGVRYQKIDVAAQPVINFNTRVATPTTVTTNGVTRNTYTFTDTLVTRRVGDLQRTSEDVLPSFNLALWPIENELVVRYSIAKQRARPSLAQLTGTSAVNCMKVDASQREALEDFLAANPGAIDDGDASTDDGAESGSFITSYVNRCTGTIGNPELKGYEAMTQNLSLEWYPNKDSQISIATYNIDVKSGRPESYSVGGFELEEEEYEATTYRDGDGGLTTKGIEIAGRTAFTFLPSILKYTGGGFNYSTAESNLSTTRVDPLTGTILPPKGESKYYYNINLWYDDGRLNVRVAYQARDIYFNRLEAESSNRIPASFPGIDGTKQTSYYKIVTPIYKSKVNSLDARASYKINNHVQLFIEGKNLLNDSIYSFAHEEQRVIGDGIPYLFDSAYHGKKFYFGIISTF